MKSSLLNACATLYALATLICLGPLTLAQAQSPAPAMSSAQFARNAAEHFTTQLEAARVAQSKSKSPAVRDFASRLASDYEKADRELTSLCESLNVDVPPQPGSSGREVAGAPATTPDPAFDRVYTLELSQALAKAESAYDAAVRSPKVDPKLKEFARKQIGAIRDYRKLGETLAQRQAGVDKASPEGAQRAAPAAR